MAFSINTVILTDRKMLWQSQVDRDPRLVTSILDFSELLFPWQSLMREVLRVSLGRNDSSMPKVLLLT